MSDRSFGNLRNEANIGDLVTSKGYEGQLFQIHAYTHEIYHDLNFAEEAIIYDAVDVRTNVYAVLFQEDITIICEADDAAEYVEKNINKYEGSAATWMELPSIVTNVQYTSEPREVDDDVIKRAKSDKVDELLAELSDVMTLIEMFGEHEDDEKKDRKYTLRANEIKAKLIELTAEGGK